MTGYPTPTFDSVTTGQLTASNLPPNPNTAIELAYFRVNSTGTAYEARTPAQMSGDVTYQNPATGAVSRTLAAKLGDYLTVYDFGATGNGTTDDTAAIQAAFTAMEASGGMLIVPPGIYNLASAGTTFTFSSSPATLKVIGAGADTSIFRWPSGQGLTVNYKNQFNALTISDIGFQTGTAGGSATGLTLS